MRELALDRQSSLDRQTALNVGCFGAVSLSESQLLAPPPQLQQPPPPPLVGHWQKEPMVLISNTTVGLFAQQKENAPQSTGLARN